MPAGGLAGVGWIEFNWDGPPYDGGFVGDLMLFGGFLALGQAPFSGLFVSSLVGRVVGRSPTGSVAAFLSALLWSVAGLVGWTMGSYVEVGLASPLYSPFGVVAGTVPWIVVGMLGAAVFVAALVSVRGAARVASGVAWAVGSAVGGLLYEHWASLAVAARQNPVKDAIGMYLEGAGVAENVAYEVVPNALIVPVLYRILTDLALFTIFRLGTRTAA